MADLDIRVTPGASHDRVGPYADGVLALRVAKSPTDGAANRAALRLVARALDLAPSRLALVAGERARAKRIRISGVDAAELRRRLARIGSD